jgi:hypothetical protein
LILEQAAWLEDLQQSIKADRVGEDDESKVRASGRRATRTAAAAKKAVVAAVVEEASLAFWIAMFDYELKDREFESSIISAAAVLGLEVERRG